MTKGEQLVLKFDSGTWQIQVFTHDMSKLLRSLELPADAMDLFVAAWPEWRARLKKEGTA